jgi:vacuolar protein sorting-associated protein VTA1
MDVPDRDADATAYIGTLMDQVEQMKKAAASVMKGEEQDKLAVENFALRVFAHADNEDREGRATRDTALGFHAASVFMDVCQVFGPLASDIGEKVTYAQWKAADIQKALRAGRKPGIGSFAEQQEATELGDDSKEPGTGAVGDNSMIPGGPGASSSSPSPSPSPAAAAPKPSPAPSNTPPAAAPSSGYQPYSGPPPAASQPVQPAPKKQYPPNARYLEQKNYPNLPDIPKSQASARALVIEPKHGLTEAAAVAEAEKMLKHAMSALR